jgi:hypothetical protein
MQTDILETKSQREMCHSCSSIKDAEESAMDGDSA